ncbi:MAG: patatin-like phospholipase family protein [Candidatus Izemoplasma sp.]
MEKIGIALAGGGARGAYQIGAWKAIIELGLDKKINVYSGASVGSLNAVLYAMGDYQKAYDTWMSLNKDSLFNLEKKIYKRIFSEKLNFLNQGIFETDRLEEIMDEVVDLEKIIDKEIYISATVLGNENSTFFDLLKTNYRHFYRKDHQVKYIKLNKMSEAEIKTIMLASCAIPVAFKPITINGETFYDGGILENTPITPLIEAGCTKIIAIDLFRYNFQRKKHIDGVKIVYVYPKHSLRGILDFNPKYIERRFELGYEDTMNVLKEQFEEII